MTDITVAERSVDGRRVYEYVYKKKNNQLVLATLELFKEPLQKEVVQNLLMKYACEAIIECVKKMEPIPNGIQ